MQILSPKRRTPLASDSNSLRSSKMEIISPENELPPETEITEDFIADSTPELHPMRPKPASPEIKRFRGVMVGILVLVLGLWGIRKMAGVNHAMPGYHSWIYTPEKYNALLTSLKTDRKSLAEQYAAADTDEKKKVIEEARGEFLNSVEEQMFPFWYGTKWAYHGTTEVPGQGKIACGYFVTTVLRDAGCDIDRSGLAQAPSEEMIKNLTTETHIKRYSGVDLPTFVKGVKETGDGLYIVGLDTHTGFISCDQGKVTFIHSRGDYVVRENALRSRALKRSNYRVTGKISDDDAFIKDWMGV